MNKLEFLTSFAINGIHFDLTTELDGLINSNCEYDRTNASKNKSLTKEQINKLVNDSSWRVRYHIAKNKNLTQEQVIQLAQDKDWLVRDQASEHPLYKQEIKS